MKKWILLASIGWLLSSCVEEKGRITVSDGKLEVIEAFASDYVTSRPVYIWLPPDYSASASYPVFYMHDGRMLFDSTTTWNKQEWQVDEVVTELIEQDKIPPIIVVGVANGGIDRHIEYFPAKPFEQLPTAFQDSLVKNVNRGERQKLFTAKPASDAYLKFLVEELKPYIDEQYATRLERANTFIMGSSMGGLISWYALCEYPEVFGGAGCLSTHWIGVFDTVNNPIPREFANYLELHLPPPESHKIYFDYGTVGLDALYEPAQMMVDSVMQHLNYTEENWKTLRIKGGDHREKDWAARLHIPLMFLMGRD